jgi:hypothetical protein
LRRFTRALERHATGVPPEAFEAASDSWASEAHLHYVGEPISLVACAELVRFWVEDLEHATMPVPAAGRKQAVAPS